LGIQTVFPAQQQTQMTTPTIREAIFGDCSRLAELCTQLGYPSSTEDLSRRLPGILASTDQAVFVAEVNGKVAGWVHVLESATLETDRMAEVGGLVVDESIRGQGVGKALMGQAETWARGRGCQQLRLRSNIRREAAHQFYKSLGYAILKTSYTFRKQF
jgi:GNAT superfamily N-acetyltransferase